MVRTRAATKAVQAVPVAAEGHPRSLNLAGATEAAGGSRSAAAAASAPVQGGSAPAKRRRGKSKVSSSAHVASLGQLEQDQEGEAGGKAAGGDSKRRRNEVVVPEPPMLCFCPTARQPAIRVGTSGYNYKHWRPGFYEDLPQRLEWERYARQFDMVELNATFYGWHAEEVYDSWRERAAAVRPTFQYVLKAPQLYTHRKRLKVDQVFLDSWARFWARCERLGPHLGPILFQLPGNFKTTSGKGKDTVNNIDRLRRLGELLPSSAKFVFEFRDASWLCTEVYSVLRQYNWCLAITHCTDGPGRQKLGKDGWIGTLQPGPNPAPQHYPLDCCTWGVYVRFHGSEGQYRGRHGAEELARWAEWAQKWTAQGRSVWLAFNNDNVPVGEQLPAAISDCQDLSVALKRCGLWPG